MRKKAIIWYHNKRLNFLLQQQRTKTIKRLQHLRGFTAEIRINKLKVIIFAYRSQSWLIKYVVFVDLNNLVKWFTDWRMLFNPGKCKHFALAWCTSVRIKSPQKQQTQSKTSRKRDPWKYTMSDSSANITTPLGTTEQERDLGIIITNDLQLHIQIINSAMGKLKRTFKAWDTNTFRTLYCSSIRSHLEYASADWSPHSKQEIKILEDVQRLKKIGIPRLSARRPRGDAIQLYKSVNDYSHINWHHTNSQVSSLGC